MLQRRLGEACIRGLKHHSSHIAVIDGMDHSTLSRGMLLAAAIVLSKQVKATIPGKRVGIVLPPSKGAVLANLAVLLAGKVPVSLNFTAGPDALKSAMRRAEIDTVITAKIVERKMENFPWPEKIVRLDEVLPPLKKRIGLWAGTRRGDPMVGADPVDRPPEARRPTTRRCCSSPAAVPASRKASS